MGVWRFRLNLWFLLSNFILVNGDVGKVTGAGRRAFICLFVSLGLRSFSSSSMVYLQSSSFESVISTDVFVRRDR